MIRPLAIVLALLPATGQAASIYGEWCNETGDYVLYVDGESLGIGEHRVCEWADAPVETDMHASAITCRRYEIIDTDAAEIRAEVVEEVIYDFSAKLIADDRLHAEFLGGTDDLTYDYSRCES